MRPGPPEAPRRGGMGGSSGAPVALDARGRAWQDRSATSAPSHKERWMRTYYDIDLGTRKIAKRELHGEEIIRAGRYLIAKTLLERGVATVDPLSAANPLIFSAGPFA